MQALTPGLVSGLAGGVVGAVLVVGGVQTYSATTTSDTSGGPSSTVTYADE